MKMTKDMKSGISNRDFEWEGMSNYRDQDLFCWWTLAAGCSKGHK